MIKCCAVEMGRMTLTRLCICCTCFCCGLPASLKMGHIFNFLEILKNVFLMTCDEPLNYEQTHSKNPLTTVGHTSSSELH